MRLRRNAMSIYQDLVDGHGFTAQDSSVMRFARKLRHQNPEQFDRLEFAPGEEMQVDYGEGAPTRVLGTDRYRRPRLFVATLRYSRRSFRRVVWKFGQQVWAELHDVTQAAASRPLQPVQWSAGADRRQEDLSNHDPLP